MGLAKTFGDGLGKGNLTKLLRSLEPGGRISAPPVNFFQTGTASNVQLNAANDGICIMFTPETDYPIPAISGYIGALGTEGVVNATLNAADGTSLEPNGALNGSVTNAGPTMTSNSAPSPNVVACVDENGTAVYTESSAWNSFDHDIATYFNAAHRWNIDNAAATDEGGGKIGVPMTGKGTFPETGQSVLIAGTGGYCDGTFTADASSTADKLVITSAYGAGKTFAGTEYVYCSPNANHPLFLTLDLGAGNSLTPNKISTCELTSSNYLTDFEFSGSNVADAEGQTEEDWTSLKSVTGQAATITDQYFYYSFTNSTAYRHFRWKITGVVAGATSLYVQEFGLISAETITAPGTELQDWGELATGAGTGWVQWDVTDYVCQRGKTYFLTILGDASTDVSFVQNRNKTGAGAALNDGVKCFTTTDGGTTWTAALEDSLPAEFCFVLNPSTNNVAKGHYGRYNGEYLYLPGSGLKTIPAAGVSFSCEALTVDTVYYLYMYDSSGTLTADPSTTAPTLNNGILVKTGATSRRLVGYFAPAENISTYYGMVDVEDQRWVRNLFNRIEKALGKPTPYSSTTTPSSVVDNNWHELAGSAGDMDFDCLALPGDTVTVSYNIGTSGGPTMSFGMAVNGYIPYDDLAKHRVVGSFGNFEFQLSFDEIGLRTLRPIYFQGTGASISLYLFYSSTTYGYMRLFPKSRLGV